MTSVMSEADTEALPLDFTTMREGAARLLVEGGRPLSDQDLETLRLQLRGHLELLIPAVEKAADGLTGTPAKRVGAAVFVARAGLRLGDGDTRIVRLAVARRLADSVRILCQHLERAGGGGR